MPPVIVRYRKILALTLANNAILFTESAIIGHRVQIKMSVDDLNTYFIWRRQSGSPRPVGHFLSDVSGVKFQEILLDSLNKSYTDLDSVRNGLNFSSYIFDNNTDGRTRVSGRVSANDLVMAYVLYKCYGSSSCPTASVIYNLEDAQAMITSGGVAMSIVGSFDDDEATACAADLAATTVVGTLSADYGGVDAMFRNMLGTVPLRYFQANGTQVPGLFEANYLTADPSAQGSWNFLENDCLELRVQFTFQQPVAHESINEVGMVGATTVINAGDSFSIRLQILATDTPSGAAAKRVAAIAAIAAASQQTVESQRAAAIAAMTAAAEAQQAVNAAALQQQADTDQYFSILSNHAQQEIYTKNSETIYKNATAALFAAIQYNGADSIIQTARATAINAAANYAETQIILANLSTRMLNYQFAKQNAVSTLNGAQIVAAARILASATAAGVSAQVALTTAQANAAIIALNTNTSYSSIMIKTQLQEFNQSLLQNQINLTASSNASRASFSNFLIAQANHITAFNTLNSSKTALNNAIILGKPLGIVSGNLNAAVETESKAKSTLLSTNIAFITAIAAESAALNTLLTNKYTAANLSNLLAIEVYNAASSNLSNATVTLSNSIVMNSNIQATLANTDPSSTSSIIGYTAAATSTATLVTMNSADLTSKQVLLNAANSNMMATAINLSNIISSNAAALFTFSTSIIYNYTVPEYSSASNINTAHINYNIALEEKESAQAALTIAQTILNTANVSPQELALLEIKVIEAQATLNRATIAFNNSSNIYTSTATSIAEDPNSFAILSVAASQLTSSISTAMNNRLADNLYSALSTQNSLMTVLNGYSLESQIASANLASAIASGTLNEIQALNSKKADITAAYATAAIAAARAANAVSVAKATATYDVSILESAALLSYSTSQARAATALVEQVTAAYEVSAIALHSSFTAQLNYSTAVHNLYNGLAGGYNIKQITPLQQAVNLEAYLYSQAVAAAVRASQVLVLGEASASVNPMAKSIIDTTLVSLNASATAGSVNSYASTLIAAKAESTSRLINMAAAQGAYNVANLRLDTEIINGTSIAEIQAAQSTLMATGSLLASTTQSYNRALDLVNLTSINLSTSTAYVAANATDPLGQAITKVIAETASLATSLSTQIGTIASAEVVNLASIAYDAQNTSESAFSTVQAAVLNYRIPAYILTAIANFVSMSSLQAIPSAPLLSTSNITDSSFDLQVLSVGATSYAFTLNGIEVIPVGSAYTFSGLTERSYTLRVVCSNSLGSSSASTIVTLAPRRPTEPTNIITSLITANSFTVSWDSSGATSYTFVLNGSSYPSDNSTAQTISGLTPSTEYLLVISAVNSAGYRSTPVRVTTTADPPPPVQVTTPYGVTSTAYPGGFTIKWAGGDYSTFYTYTIDGSPVVPSVDNGVVRKSASFTGIQGTIVVVTAENPYDSESSMPVSINN